MQATITKDYESPDYSDDCGDWTLVSSPHSSSLSSHDSEEVDLDKVEEPQQVLDSSRLENLKENSNQHEIDHSLCRSEAKEEEEEAGRSSIEPGVPGFQAIETTDDDDQLEEVSLQSSLTQSELGEYVDLGRKLLHSTETLLQYSDSSVANSTIRCIRQGGVVVMAPPKQEPQEMEEEMDEEEENRNYVNETLVSDRTLLCIKRKMDELSRAVNRRGKESHLISPLYLVLIMSWVVVLLGFLVEVHEQNLAKSKRHSDSKSKSNARKTLDFEANPNPIATNQYKELLSLHDELTRCIKRQSPNSYKYYTSEERFKEETETRPRKVKKLKRGLVCYGQENRWRERFDQLRKQFKLDLRKLIQETKNQITSDIMETYHPALQFKLILNQLEYLDFLESKRNKKQQEETIRFLKAENMLLVRRLNHPNEKSFRKLVTSLELENSRLRRENEALKMNLVDLCN